MKWLKELLEDIPNEIATLIEIYGNRRLKK